MLCIQPEAEVRARAAAERELASYMYNKSGREVSSGADLMRYWKKNQNRLFDGVPSLAALARSLHAIPASSAKAERTFSEAGRIIEKRRTRLLSSRVDDLLLIRDNRDLLP